MTSHEFTSKFRNEVYAEVNEQDFSAMLWDEADSEMKRLHELRKRPKHEEVLQTAYNRIADWFTHASEYKTTPQASFVASHRRACVWAVFLGLEANGKRS